MCFETWGVRAAVCLASSGVRVPEALCLALSASVTRQLGSLCLVVQSHSGQCHLVQHALPLRSQAQTRRSKAWRDTQSRREEGGACSGEPGCHSQAVTKNFQRANLVFLLASQAPRVFFAERRCEDTILERLDSLISIKEVSTTLRSACACSVCSTMCALHSHFSAEWADTELKTWAQKGSRKAQWVLERDAAVRHSVMPAGLSALKQKEAQLVIFNELSRIFYHEYKSLFDKQDDVSNDCGSTVFANINNKYKQTSFTNASVEEKLWLSVSPLGIR
eukprot:736968-Rhodomonas_salina.1